MYVPAHFAADDDDVRRLLATHGAADLVTTSPDGLVATMLPFVFDDSDGPNGSLLGHVAKANGHWRHPVQGEALVIVRGVDSYISPSWYPSKVEHHEVVPTWNYSVAHVYGTLEWHHDPAWIETIVRWLTDKHEGLLGVERPWSVDDAPSGFIQSQLKAVVGIRIEISRIEAKVKMSQNRLETDVRGVIDGLESSGNGPAAAGVRSANAGRLEGPPIGR